MLTGRSKKTHDESHHIGSNLGNIKVYFLLASYWEKRSSFFILLLKPMEFKMASTLVKHSLVDW